MVSCREIFGTRNLKKNSNSASLSYKIMKPFMTFNECVSKTVDWEVDLNETIQRTGKSNRPNQVSWQLRFSTNQCFVAQ